MVVLRDSLHTHTHVYGPSKEDLPSPTLPIMKIHIPISSPQIQVYGKSVQYLPYLVTMN